LLLVVVERGHATSQSTATFAPLCRRNGKCLLANPSIAQLHFGARPQRFALAYLAPKHKKPNQKPSKHRTLLVVAHAHAR